MALSRKNFLRLSGLGISAATVLPFTLEAAPKPPADVKITKVNPYIFEKVTFVKIETGAGISG